MKFLKHGFILFLPIIAPFAVQADGYKPFEHFKECDVCPEMIALPTGEFPMGATPEESRNPFDFHGENATMGVRTLGELNIIPDEHPRHRVFMDYAFAIGRNEVTRANGWPASMTVAAAIRPATLS